MSQPDQDRADLGRFGYAQELFRNMGGFSNFAVSFSIISILTGASTLFGYGLEMGGPLEMTLGWPLATVFTLAVAASMAELCSAYPTAGAMYHWAADLGGTGWGWLVAWLNILGLIATQAGINYSCAQFVLPFLNISSSQAHLLWMFGFILLTQGALNHYGVRLVAILNDVSVTVHIVGVLLVVVALVWFAPKQPAAFLLAGVNSNGRAPYWWAFLLGLLQAQWTYTGFDASAHLAEETQDPRRRAPWGIVLAVGISGVVGYFLILAVTLAIRSIPAALAAKDAQGEAIPAVIAILDGALGARMGNAMAALASMAMWFCGLACIASASRALYSLARDNGTPLAPAVRWVSPRHGTPASAIWLIVAASFGAMIWAGAIPIVTSLSVVALYLAYTIPVVLGWRARRAGSPWPGQAVWSLGRYGPAVNLAAIGYAAFICVVLIMPPNELAGKTLAGLLAALGLLYFVEVRKKFQGPAWSLRRQDSACAAGERWDSVL
ncbi:MAG TPA: amino acid permease [Bryobacteraceae bacterium]|nr:amino acid permease [Bryobacteraceae bacterium]